MKSSIILLATILGIPAIHAATPQIIDLGNGSTVEILDGKVTVKSSSTSKDSTGPSSASSSTSSSTDAAGNTVTKVTSEVNGKRTSRTITIGPDGKATISRDVSPAPGDKPDKPAAETQPGGGWLGVHVVPVSDAVRAQVDIPESQGIIVELTAPDGPAAKAGLQQNDILTTLNDSPIASVEDFRARLRQIPPATSIRLGYLRKGKQDTLNIILGNKPADPPPGEAVAGEAGRLHRKGLTKANSHRAVVVDENGEVSVVDGDGAAAADAFDLLLNDPKVPESITEHIRKSRVEIQKQTKEHAAPGAPGADD